METEIYTHELKSWTKYFDLILQGIKRFELRRDDRGFGCGDTLILREYDPRTQSYLKRRLSCRINSVFFGHQGLKEGYCILGITDVVLLPQEREVSDE
jgi:hypothetical protein